MQQGRGGMGSHKHGVSGHAGQNPRLRLIKKIAAERGELEGIGSRSGSNSQRCEMRSAAATSRAKGGAPSKFKKAISPMQRPGHPVC